MVGGGIAAQYGFLYQKYFYINSILENHSVHTLFRYEGTEDIDIKNINYETDGCSFFIQVKSGHLTKEEFKKVIANWLNIDENKNCKYRLILENEISFDYNNDIIKKDLIEAIKASSDKKKTSTYRKVFEKFKNSADSTLETKIFNILSSYEKICISLEKLKEKIEKNFHTLYGNNVNRLISRKRSERFSEYISQKIDASIEKKETCELNYSNIHEWIFNVKEDITEDKYNIPDLYEFKKKLKSSANELLNLDLREVKELKLVSNNENFILKALVNKLLYEDFREIYTSEDLFIKIKNIENEAKDNYDDVKFELENVEKISSKDLYDKTLNKDIRNELLPKSTEYLKGCYIFLTSDKAPEQFKISWEI